MTSYLHPCLLLWEGRLVSNQTEGNQWAGMFTYYNSNVVLDIPAPPRGVLVDYLHGKEDALVEYLRGSGCNVSSTVWVSEPLVREYTGIPRNEVAVLATIFRDFVDSMEGYVEDTEHYSYMARSVKDRIDSLLTVHVPTFKVSIYPATSHGK